jgi:hypothetical protein
MSSLVPSLVVIEVHQLGYSIVKSVYHFHTSFPLPFHTLVCFVYLTSVSAMRLVQSTSHLYLISYSFQYTPSSTPHVSQVTTKTNSLFLDRVFSEPSSPQSQERKGV